MSLSPAQLSSVAEWFAAGASLDEIQKRLAAEFDVHMTYLDLRLLVADLPQPDEVGQAVGGASRPGEPPEEQSVPGRAVAPRPPSVGRAVPGEPSSDAAMDGTEPVPPTDVPPPSDLSVTVDPITPPGVMAGGGVTFSDGTSGKWYLDSYGRLGLADIPEGYRPSPEDAALFQSRLLEALRAKGLA